MGKTETEQKEKIHLVQFKLSEKAFNDLIELKKETGNLTISEVVRDAIKLLRWAVEMRGQGYTLFALPDNEKGKKFEVVLPSLPS